MTRFTLALPLFALACTPQSAELVSGEMVGFMSTTTSFTLIKGNFDPADAEESWNIDCREDLGEDEDLLRLPDALDICGGNRWPPEDEVWLNQGAYQNFRMPMDTWRGEAVMLNEGDVQVGFHQRMPGGEDFRFVFTIDPTFQPTSCVGDGNGGFLAEPIDGDWVGGWSEEIARLNEEDNLPPFLDGAAEASAGGELYFLNAFSFQWDPDADDDTSRGTWTLPEEWRSGYSIGTFVEERMHTRNNRMADPGLYILFEAELGGGIPRDSIFYAQCEDGDQIGDCPEWRDVRRQVRTTAEDVSTQLARATPDGNPFFMPIAHANDWRTHNGRAPGLDGWGELVYSWVMLTPDSNVEQGGNMHGFFSIVLDGDDSQTRIFVQGEFDVPKIKREKWGAVDLRQDKLDEAGIELCIQ